MIQIGKWELGREEISIALMIFFAMFAMFFLGYKLAYDQAIDYANEQIIEITEDFKREMGLVNQQEFVFDTIDFEEGGFESDG